ncbi:MAG: hypothetical protein ABJF23_23735, partial [Bryobacteraceae bacterium]
QSKLFQSFWQAGFECSTHVLRSGKRLDLVSASRHDVFAERDFMRLKELDISTAREGLRWHLIEPTAGNYDFSTVLPILEAARRQGVQIIWDLLHFGWPQWLDIFDGTWVESFAAFGSSFGRFLQKNGDGAAFVAPVNEISFASWAGGDVAYLNPFATGRGGELKKQLVRGYLQSANALRAEIAGIRLVAPEPAIYIAGDPTRPEDVLKAAEYTSSMYEAWDMISGRAQPELGGGENYLDVIGINYYDRNQWFNYGKTIDRNDPEYRPFRLILAEIYRRYERPLFVSETGAEDDGRAGWLTYIADEVSAAIRAGVPVEGICLYPVLNHPGWDDDRHCFNGLWDYAQPSGEREIFAPLAEVIERYKFLERQSYELPNPLYGATARRNLLVTPSLEFCFSTTPTFNE